MRILITPEANTAETAGSIVRTKAIALAALESGHDVAFCAGDDINFSKIANTQTYSSEIPTPIGLPKILGRPAYKLFKYFGLQKNETVEDYETIFHFIGLSSYAFFKKDVENVRKAIKVFKPDIVFTEHRPSPIVAAKLENIKVATTYSLPIHNSFTNKNYGKYSNGIARYIRNIGLPSIKSVLDLYNWTDAKFIPSTYELEPVDAEKLHYIGPLIDYNKSKQNGNLKNNILVYMGNSGFTSKEIARTITEAFIGTKWNVYIASKEMAQQANENINISQHFDFNVLLANAFVFISHGGQNSLMQSLLYGVPMISFPGGVHERRFNSAVLERLHVGRQLENEDFTSKKLLQTVAEIENDKTYIENSNALGRKIIMHGGAKKLIDILESIV